MTNFLPIDNVCQISDLPFQHELHLNFPTRKSEQPPKQTKATPVPQLPPQALFVHLPRLSSGGVGELYTEL